MAGISFFWLAAAMLVLANREHCTQCTVISNKLDPASMRVSPKLKSSMFERQTETMCEIHTVTVKNGFIICKHSYYARLLIYCVQVLCLAESFRARLISNLRQAMTYSSKKSTR
jgi:hypothetical protein